MAMAGFRRLFWKGAWAAGLVLLLPGAAGAKELVPLRKVEAFVERDGVAAGGTLSLAVKATLNRDFHVNSHQPSEEYLIPTRIEAGNLPDVELGDWTYPEGEMKKFPFSQEPLRVYEGTFLVRGSLRVGPGAPAGPRRLLLSLRYQACTKEKCLPPRTEEISLDFRVVTGGTGTRPLHPDLFPPPAR